MEGAAFPDARLISFHCHYPRQTIYKKKTRIEPARSIRVEHDTSRKSTSQMQCHAAVPLIDLITGWRHNRMRENAVKSLKERRCTTLIGLII